MLNKETYIRAILESNFAGFKDEIIENAVQKIMEYEEEEYDEYYSKHRD